MVGAPGAWSKRVVPILLMSNRCVLGLMCNKPMRVSFPIPFKSQLHSRHGGYTIYMAEFASVKTERFSSEETDLLVREVKAREQTIYIYGFHQSNFYLYARNNNLLHCNPFIFNIWHVCVLQRVPVCFISRVYACCAPAYRHILLMHFLNNKKNFAAGFSRSMAQSISVASK